MLNAFINIFFCQNNGPFQVFLNKKHKNYALEILIDQRAHVFQSL